MAANQHETATGARLVKLAIGAAALAVLALDQLTKVLAEGALMPAGMRPNDVVGSSRPLFTVGGAPGCVGESFVQAELLYFRNFGIAWGNLAQLPESLRLPMLSAISLGALVASTVLLQSLRARTRGIWLAYLLVCAGTVGNLIDRVRIGYVIDFMAVRWSLMGWCYEFPVFNVADVAICGGLALLIVLSALGRRRRAPSRLQ